MGQQQTTNLRMRSARAALGWTQQDLAAAIGATRQTIGLIENGLYNPSLKLCLSIAHALNKKLDDLFWEEASNA
ncbi:helix-turn-helix transcriptional regulator [bacterium]|nr:helix-turn-helix transcriptional regulator [bacterium]